MLNRRRAKRVLAAVLTCVAVVLFLRWLWLPVWKPLARRHMPRWTQRFAKAAEAHSELRTPPEGLIQIGHRAGSFEEYAKSVDDLESKRSVNELMDLSFGELGLNAIEVDVRSSPLDDVKAVVVHDAIAPGELSVAARKFIRANSVAAVLRHFVAKGYHRQGKRIFFELKASDATRLDPDAKAAIDGTAAALEAILRGRTDAALVRRHVELISFNQHALEYASVALGAAAPLHRLHMILTTNQHSKLLFETVRSDLRVLDEAVTAWLAKTPLISGVFFDPRYVDGFAGLFNGINERRTCRGLAPLALHLSTYSHDYAEFVERLKAAGQPLKNVRGLVYEVARAE